MPDRKCTIHKRLKTGSDWPCMVGRIAEVNHETSTSSLQSATVCNTCCQLGALAHWTLLKLHHKCKTNGKHTREPSVELLSFAIASAADLDSPLRHCAFSITRGSMNEFGNRLCSDFRCQMSKKTVCSGAVYHGVYIRSLLSNVLHFFLGKAQKLGKHMMI
jgi:hypothetical protein